MRVVDKPEDQKAPGVDKPGILVMDEPKGDKRQDVVVRCTIANGVELRVWDMGLEIPTSKEHQLARLKDTFLLKYGDDNVVPSLIWDQWREQNPGKFPGVMELWRQDAPDEPRP